MTESNGKQQASIDYYVNEWKNADSFGILIRGVVKGTGLSLSETLLYLLWLERFAQNAETRRHNAVYEAHIAETDKRNSELAPLQKKMLEHANKHIDEEEKDADWRET